MTHYDEAHEDSTKVRLGSAGLIGALGGRGAISAAVDALVLWGSQVFSGMAGTRFMRRVGVSAIWALSGEKRTRRGHFETVAIDPERALRLRRKVQAASPSRT